MAHSVLRSAVVDGSSTKRRERESDLLTTYGCGRIIDTYN
jgi:hypothetical protein